MKKTFLILVMLFAGAACSPKNKEKVLDETSGTTSTEEADSVNQKTLKDGTLVKDPRK